MTTGAPAGSGSSWVSWAAPVDSPLTAVLAPEDRRLVAAVGGQPDGGEDRIDGARVEVLVLGGEGVDRGRNDPDLLTLQALPDELPPGEDVGIRLLDVGREEGPGPPRELVGMIDADVAAPDHLDPGITADRVSPAGCGSWR